MPKVPFVAVCDDCGHTWTPVKKLSRSRRSPQCSKCRSRNTRRAPPDEAMNEARGNGRGPSPKAPREERREERVEERPVVAPTDKRTHGEVREELSQSTFEDLSPPQEETPPEDARIRGMSEDEFERILGDFRVLTVGKIHEGIRQRQRYAEEEVADWLEVRHDVPRQRAEELAGLLLSRMPERKAES
ncbi:MAG: hydrogenase maturation nickel metallochaperone HypA [Candidatus Thermoplasmatota archaeon]|nr:hydrogenase maturation nickel metallochaperone HypA [Candidatus Thermoplasmatota archaeon]